MAQQSLVKIIISHKKYKGLQNLYLKQIISWNIDTWDYTREVSEAGRFTPKQALYIKNILAKKPTITFKEEQV